MHVSLNNEKNIQKVRRTACWENAALILYSMAVLINIFLLLCSSVRPEICNNFAFTEVRTHLHLPILISCSVESNFGDGYWKIGRSLREKNNLRDHQVIFVVFALIDHSSRPIKSPVISQ